MSCNAIQLHGTICCPRCGDEVPLVGGRLGVHVDAVEFDACDFSSLVAAVAVHAR
ncbi:hypothetical protein [Nocardia abscessus]|uniref:hypothetical protein n=1 Tax=Nocardia abscessus TaxID=120957 RepID=UPI0024572509|nr:hypothetical protein [Nocardia abscessus]